MLVASILWRLHHYLCFHVAAAKTLPSHPRGLVAVQILMKEPTQCEEKKKLLKLRLGLTGTRCRISIFLILIQIFGVKSGSNFFVIDFRGVICVLQMETRSHSTFALVVLCDISKVHPNIVVPVIKWWDLCGIDGKKHQSTLTLVVPGEFEKF